jgi:RNA polymerase sigma-70 factor (ECF subfamily)
MSPAEENEDIDELIKDPSFWNSLGELPELMAKLYDCFYLKAYAYAVSKTQDSASAEDLVHNLFVKLLSGKYPPDPAFPIAWLRKIIHNDFLHEVRRNKKRRPEDPIHVLETLAPQSETSEVWSSLIQEEYATLLAACLEALPEPNWDAVWLRYFRDLTLAQMSDAMGMAPATWSARCSDALQMLKQCLESKGLNEAMSA